MSKPKHKKPKSQKSIARKQTLPNWLYNQRTKLLLIFGLSFLIYANTLKNEYALDDAIVITDNMFTQKGFGGIADHFTNELFYGFFKDESKANLVSGGRYRPLSVAMFAFEYGIFGENPFIGHLMNILLYGFTGIVLFLVLSSLFKKQKDNYSILLPFVAAILYVTHPIHTEVVANIKGRDEILALLGSLGALYYILRAYSEKNTKYIVLATTIFFLALLSKENAITYLAVVPIALIYFLKARIAEAIKYTLPLLGAAALFLVIRSAIVPLSLGDAPRELMNNPFLKIEGGQYVDFTFAEQLATVLYSWGCYIKLLIFPHPLSHDYYPRQIDLMTFGDWQVILSVVVIALIAFFALKSLKTKHVLGFCAIYFLATFSIVSNLLFPIGTGMSERFMYMASVGFSLACAYSIIEGAIWLQEKGQLKFPLYKSVLFVTILIAGLYSIKTILRNPVWQDNYTLFTTDVKTSTRSAKLQNAAGGTKIERASKMADEAAKNKLLTEAVEHLSQAVQIHPNYKNAYLLRGNANNNLKNFDLAISDYRMALQLDPDYQDAFNNLVITFKQAGRYHGEERGDVATGKNYLLQALQMSPKDYEVNRLLGISFGVEGNHNQAIQYFSDAASIEPNNAQAWVNLSKAYFYIGDAAKQNEYRSKALALDPNAFNN